MDVCVGQRPTVRLGAPSSPVFMAAALPWKTALPPSQAPRSQGSYPSHMHLAYTPAHTAPTPSHLQNTAPWHTSTRGPGSQSFAYARPSHPTPCCKARYDHTHLSHIHAYIHIYLTSSDHTHTHTPHTSDLPVTPIAHLTCIQSLTHTITDTRYPLHLHVRAQVCTCAHTHTHSHQLSALSHQPADQCSGQALSLSRRAPTSSEGLHSSQPTQSWG